MEQRQSIYELSEKSSTLSGTPRGKKLFAALITKVGRSPEPMPIFLDFEKVAVATGSFLREAVIGFRDYCRNAELNLFPVVANANPDILDELKMVLELRGDAIVICNLDDKGRVTSPDVVGSLEEKQQLTFAARPPVRPQDGRPEVQVEGAGGEGIRLRHRVEASDHRDRPGPADRGLLVAPERGAAPGEARRSAARSHHGAQLQPLPEGAAVGQPSQHEEDRDFVVRIGRRGSTDGAPFERAHRPRLGAVDGFRGGAGRPSTRTTARTAC